LFAVMAAALEVSSMACASRCPGAGAMSASLSPALDDEVPLAAESLGLFGIDLEVNVQFRRSGYQALQSVTCEFHEGTARLCVHLPTFLLKQIAQEIVCAVVGVRSVVNQIEVGPRRAPDTAARSEPDRTDWSDATGYQP
jgi:hypothetical protein